MAAVDLLRRYSNASLVLDDADVRNCAKITEIAKRVMWEKARLFALQSASMPLLYNYSGDGTPITTRARTSAGPSDNRTVHREGGELSEFFMQKAFLKRIELDGREKVLPLIRDPVVMSEGKTAGHQFAACEAFFPSLRECGHTGIAVSHYCFDRACQAALERLLRQKHALRHPGDPASQ